MKKIVLKGLEYYLPEDRLNNEELVANQPDWTAEKIHSKTGIAERRISAEGETAGDLAEKAANKLFDSGICKAEDVQFILLCTEAADYLLPCTATLLQDRLNIPKTAGALDFNLGCSGFVYGLSLAKGLIETGQVDNVLLLTTDTYTKFIEPDDIGVRAIFGDGAAATFLEATESDQDLIGPFVFGSNGAGYDKIIVKAGGARHPTPDESVQRKLEMNGPEVFSFTISTVPRTVKKLLEDANMNLDDVDKFIYHQANTFMLEHLRKKSKIDEDRFLVDMEDIGNTVSASIPIAFKRALERNEVKSGDRIMFVGFGVGLSWAATLCVIP